MPRKKPDTPKDLGYGDKGFRSDVRLVKKTGRWKWQINYLDQQPDSGEGYRCERAARVDCEFVARAYVNRNKEAARRAAARKIEPPEKLMYE